MIISTNAVDTHVHVNAGYLNPDFLLPDVEPGWKLVEKINYLVEKLNQYKI